MTDVARLIDQAVLNSSVENRTWIVRALGEHESSLVRYAKLFVGDVDTARDIVQDTFLKLCRHTAESAEAQDRLQQTNLKAWLFRVCRNRAIDICRKENRMKLLKPNELDTAVEDAQRPTDQVQQQEQTEILNDRISELPQKQQEVLRLKFQSGLTYREIAEVMDVSATNVGFLLHTAIGKLRLQMGEES